MWQYTPRVAVIRGVRTPFAKSGTHFARLTALDLGKMAVTELVERVGINPNEVQEVVFGNVIPSVKAPNIAREIVLVFGRNAGGAPGEAVGRLEISPPIRDPGRESNADQHNLELCGHAERRSGG